MLVSYLKPQKGTPRIAATKSNYYVVPGLDVVELTIAVLVLNGTSQRSTPCFLCFGMILSSQLNPTSGKYFLLLYVGFILEATKRHSANFCYPYCYPYYYGELGVDVVDLTISVLG